MSLQNNEQWLSLVDSFHSAALGETGWDIALQGLAAATGSRGAQLIGRHSDLSVLFNVMTGIDPDAQRVAIEMQSINPRPSVVERTPILQPVADWDVISRTEAKRDRFYQEVLRPLDAPFFCATVIERQHDMFVTLGVMRSHADGYITPEQRETFSLVAPHVRAAVRMQAALEGRSAAWLAQCMETLAIPLFVCDATGRVRLLTPAADALITSGRGLQLQGARLRAKAEPGNRALQDAIAAAASPNRAAGPPVAQTVVIHNPASAGSSPVVLEIFALPSGGPALSFAGLAPRVLIVACGQRRTERRRAAILGGVYRMTAAEIEIAQRLAAGSSAEDVAARRGVSVGTVRVQIKSILSKLGARRQAELVARLNQL